MLGWWRFRAAAQIFEKIKILKELRRHSMQTKFVIVLLSALLPVSVQRANAQGAVTIQSATANANQTVLTISGSNYCGSPAVTLGGVSLTVTGATSVQITVTLSAVSPGTYYLVVSCGTLAGRTAYFDVTVGAAAAGQTTTASGGCWVNGQRYADCGNGTIANSMTGLIWLKDAACAALGVPDFAAANAAVSGLHNGRCGLSDGSAAGDWRLPTRVEWLATMQGPQRLIAQFLPNCAAPPLKANNGTACLSATSQGSGPGQHAFLNVVAGGYWSSSTYELDTTYAYLVDLSVSDVSNDNNTVPHFLINGLTLNVWPVRGGSK
jgi:hypothetical protein